jgi:diguanylate cyclase (GGDEF)-like protein
MSIRTKILAALGVFVLAIFLVESALILSVKATQLKAAAGIEVRHVSGRLALAVERAGRPGSLPAGEALSQLLATELEKALSPPHESGVRPGTLRVTLADLSLPTDKQMLASVGGLEGEAELVCRETLLVNDPDAVRPMELDLVVAAPTMGIGNVLSLAYGWLLTAALVTFALGQALLLLLNRAYLRPVAKLQQAAHSVSEGDFDTRIAINTGDELQDLARGFSFMQEELVKMRKLSLDANPLTGLPGNATIHKFIEACLAKEDRVAVVYVDLDNFKAYNDVYGFGRADGLIRFTASILSEATEERDHAAFVGHVGGDDFVFAVQPEVAQAVADDVIARFDAGISQFYSEEDLARGYVIGKDRQHNEQYYGVAAVSMACVVAGSREFQHVAALMTALAELKNVAKSREGSVFLLDRRQA